MYYQINRETQKLELIFDKAEYQALPDADKSDIKSNYLFSRRIGGWVSRAKWPNTYHAEAVAKRLGAENKGKTGEALSFAEQQERKAERAEARADRMEYRSDRAAAEGARLQKPIEDMHGDIAFFTQPNINTSAGRAFTNRRNKMWASWERGWDEFKKSEYYAERAETARRTAAEAKAPSDKGFCERRIADAEKTIRVQKKNIEHYQAILDVLNTGKYYTDPSWSYIHYTPEQKDEIEGRMENAVEIMEAAMSKAIYYREALEALGGIQFSRENIKPGYIVKLDKSWKGAVEVVSCGPKNFTYKASTYCLKASYGEIVEIVKAEEKAAEQHPFRIGDTFTPELWNDATCRIEKTPVEIVKATAKTVTIQNTNTGEVWTRKPQKRTGRCYNGGETWVVFIDDSYRSGCFKPMEEAATA